MARLTKVYVDYGACDVQNNPKSTRVTPADIETIINGLANNSSVTKRIFLDSRGTEQEGGIETHNERLVEWYDYHYDVQECPRLGGMKKESIDNIMIQKIQDDVELLRHRFSLHIVLVVGDADYYPLIASLLDKKDICVSLIITVPHSTVRYEFLKRLHTSFAFFTIDEKVETMFRGIGDVADQTAQSINLLQGVYAPTPDQFSRVIAFFHTTTICPHCMEKILTGHILAHASCVDTINRPAGYMTTSSRNQEASRFSTMDPKRLLNECLKLNQVGVEHDNLRAVFGTMVIIPWSVIAVIELLQQIRNTEGGLSVDLVKDQKLIDPLNHAGVVHWGDQRYHATDHVKALQPLIGEIYARIHHPLTARLYSPEGALREDVLRERIRDRLCTAKLSSPMTESDQYEEMALWNYDTALMFLTDPHLNPEIRWTIQQKLDDIHTVNQWASRLETIKINWATEEDVLQAIEAIASGNSFMTERSIDILVANDLLQFHDRRETLGVNKGHAFFTPFQNKAVA